MRYGLILASSFLLLAAGAAIAVGRTAAAPPSYDNDPDVHCMDAQGHPALCTNNQRPQPLCFELGGPHMDKITPCIGAVIDLNAAAAQIHPTLRTDNPPLDHDLTFRDPASGITIVVQADRRHVEARSAQGGSLWMHDPFEDAHMEPYRFQRPLIDFVGAGGQHCKPAHKTCVMIGYDSSQGVIVDLNTAAAQFWGQD